MANLVAADYNKQRLQYFKRLLAKTEKSVKYWSARAANKSYISYEVDKAFDKASEASFLKDVIEMLESEAKADEDILEMMNWDTETY